MGFSDMFEGIGDEVLGFFDSVEGDEGDEFWPLFLSE